MRKSLIPILLSAAMFGPPMIMGCDKEVAHEEKTTRNADGTGTHSERTVQEKPDGTVVEKQEKKVDNTPNNANRP